MLRRICRLLGFKTASFQSADKNIVFDQGNTVPSAESGYAIGAIFIHRDGGAGTAIYTNEGTESSCSFVALGSGSTELTTDELAAINGANAPAVGNVFATAADVAGGGTLADGKVFIGDGSNAPTARDMSGDVTISNTGVAAIAAGAVVNADVNAAAAIAFSKLGALATGEIVVGNAGVPTAAALSGDATIDNAGALTIAAGAVADSMLASGLDPTKLTLASAKLLIGDGSNAAAAVTITGDITINNAGVAALAAGAIVNADINAGAAIALSKLGSDDLGAFSGAIVVGTDKVIVNDGGTLKSGTYQVFMDGVNDLTSFTGAVVPGTDTVLIDDGGTAKSATFQVFADGLDDLTAKAAVAAAADKIIITDSAASAVAKNITVQYLMDVLGDLTDLAAVPDVADRIALTDESVANDPAKSTTVENFLSAIGDVTALSAAPAIDDLMICTDESTGGDPCRAITLQEVFDAGQYLTGATIADGDSLVFLDAGTVAKIEAIGDIATLFAGGGLTAASSVLAVCDTVWPLVAFGAWAVDGDAIYTNGAGMVGDTSVTEASSTFCKSYDQGNTEYQDIATSSGGTDMTNDYQFFSDTKGANDAVYFGNAVPFCEMGIDMGGTVQDYTGDALTWEYYNGSWVTLTPAYDGTDATAQDGKRSFGRDGAVSFVPPSDWATTTIDSQLAYWIRARITTAGNIGGNEAVTNSKEHEIVSPTDGFVCPAAGNINAIRLIDQAATLHTATDIKFVLMNFTTGANSGELTFAQDQRQDRWGSLTFAVADGDELGVLVTQEDGTNEASNVMLELEVTPS